MEPAAGHLSNALTMVFLDVLFFTVLVARSTTPSHVCSNTIRLQWARDWFEGEYKGAPQAANAYLEGGAGYLAALAQQPAGQRFETLEKVSGLRTLRCSCCRCRLAEVYYVCWINPTALFYLVVLKNGDRTAIKISQARPSCPAALHTV